MTTSLGSAWPAGTHPYDLYETGDSLVLEMAVPGLRKDDLEVRLEGNRLTIRGTYPEAQGSEERRYWSRCLPRGSLVQSLILPKVKQACVRKITISAA